MVSILYQPPEQSEEHTIANADMFRYDHIYDNSMIIPTVLLVEVQLLSQAWRIFQQVDCIGC